MNLRISATLSLIILAAITVMAAGVPQMEIPETEFDFGYVPSGSTVSHVFWLKSTGNGTLKITDVKASCGCTKAPLTKSELAPGDSTQLEVIFNSRKFSNRVSKTVRVSNNIDVKSRMVTISAIIEDATQHILPLAINPRRIEVTKEADNNNQTYSVTLTNLIDQKLRLRLIDRPQQYIKAEVPQSIAAGQSTIVQVTVDREAFTASFFKSLTIETVAEDQTITRHTLPLFHKAQSLSRR